MRRVLPLLALVALAAGCSGSSDDDAVGADPAVTTTTVTATDPTAGELEDEDEEGLAELSEVASQLLVTVDEVGGPGFVDQGFSPGPCDDDLDTDHAPDVRVGMFASDALTGQALIEELRVYPDIEASAAAYDAGMFGLCEEELAERGLDPAEPVDVTAEVGADAAKRLDVSDENATVVLITAVVGDAVVSFVFNVPATAAAGPPDPLDVAAYGVGKILAALEAG